MKRFREQFIKPEGFFGWVAGFLMWWTGQEKNRWTIELLDLKEDEHVLEIGFGPGVAIQMASQRVPRGGVVGIDHSEVMLRQAMKRNKRAIEAGQVQLFLADVKALPKFETKFDKVFAVNSVMFWSEPIEVLKAIRRQMKPKGLIALTVQPYTKGARDETAKQIGVELVRYLEQAGFIRIRMELKAMKPVASVCVLGVNPC